MEHSSNTAMFMEKFRVLLETGEELPLPVQGSSMAPFLCSGRDTVWLRKTEGPLKPGDIVMCRDSAGIYALQRVKSVRDGVCTVLGDGRTEAQTGVGPEQILGRLVRAWSKGQVTGPGSFRWELFARVWLHTGALRRPLLRLAGCGGSGAERSRTDGK